MTEFASAIADLRLSGEKLNTDANTVRRQLLRITEQLEQQARVTLGVGIDVRQAQRDLQTAVNRFAQQGAFNVKVGLDTDAALDELGALIGLGDDPLVVPVSLDVEQALQDIATVDELARIDPAVIPLQVEDDDALLALDRIKNQALPDVEDAFAVAGDSAGRQFAQSLEQTVFSAVGTLSIALGAFVTTSLVRGFQRFTTIEDATASLTVALDSAAEAAIVLDDVLGVVTGTPFNLDQFANAASNLISFGVEAEKVPDYLEAIAEASASRGGRANEFAQRLANTFGQVSVQGRIMGEDILSLQATGVDALRILGNSFGETTVDIREMISEGTIPAGEALDILAEGILDGTDGINGATVAFAGTAERLRETLTGARGGFESATARLGVAFIEPFEEALTTGFNAATDIVDQFTQEIDSLLGGIAGTDGFETFVDNIAKLPDLIDPVIEGLTEFGPALAPLVAGFGALGINQLASFLAPLGLAIPQINGLVLAITALVASTPELREQVLPILGDLGEAAATLGAGLGAALGDAIEAATPLLASFAEAIGDLTPFVSDIATFTVALANGFVPVLEGLVAVLEIFPVEVLAAIGGGLLALKGLNALTGPVDGLTRSLTGFSAQLQLAEADSDRYGNRLTSLAERANISGEQINRASRAISTGLDVAASSAAGFFSGFAIASDNATTQALGFAGAVTSIGTAYATGGLPGGLLATATTIGGVLVKQWTDSKQAAEEYRDFIDEVAQDVIDDLDKATTKLLEARELLETDSGQEGALTLIGDDQLLKLREAGVDVDRLLQVAADTPEVGTQIVDAYAAAYDEAQTLTNQFILDNRDQFGNDGVTGDEAARFFADTFARGLQPAIDDVKTNADLDLTGLLDFDDIEGVITGFGAFIVNNDPFEELLEAGKDIPEVNEYLKELGLTTQQLAELEAIDIDLDVKEFGRDFELTKQQTTDLRNAIDDLGLSADDVEKLLRDADDSAQAFFDGQEELAEFGVTPYDLILKGVAGVNEEFGVLVDVTEDGSLDITKATEDVEEGFDKVSGSIEAAAAEAEKFTRILDTQLEVLDEIARNQNFAAGFDEIAATLGAIVNQDELNDAQKLIDQIGDGREAIADLQGQLAEEKADAAIELRDLDRRIAEADSLGGVNTAAALRRQRDRLLNENAEAEQEIRDQIADVAQLESELSGLSEQPITLDQLLRSQAAANDLSLAEFLISPNVSPEGREFFQGAISNQLSQFGGQLQAEFDENPLLASITIPDLTEEFVTKLATTAGLDDETARALVDLAINPEKLAQQARESFDETFNSSVAILGEAAEALLRGDQIDPSIDIDAVVEDVGGGIAALEELERQGIQIPGGVDLLAAQDTLSAFTNAAESSDFELLIPVAGDLSEIEAQLRGLENYEIQLTVERNAPDGLGPSFGNSRTGTAGQPWWLGNFSSTSNPNQGFDFGGGVLAFLDGGFYKDGGISENHIAQISGGQTPFRMWAEPETGGEAYIPLGNSKRSRSTQILTTVADMFDMDVVARSKGASVAAKTLDEDSMSRAVERGVTRARGGLPSATGRAQAHDRAARSVNVEKIEVSGVRDPNRAVRKMISRLSDVAMGLHDWDEDDY
jgi:tape measure domain-containing protein